MTDPLLDRPEWAPGWVPSVDDVRRMRWMRWAVTAVLVAGCTSCVVRGADSPPDPVLGPAPTTVPTSGPTTAPPPPPAPAPTPPPG